MWRSMLGIKDVEVIVGDGGFAVLCWEWRTWSALLGMEMGKMEGINSFSLISLFLFLNLGPDAL